MKKAIVTLLVALTVECLTPKNTVASGVPTVRTINQSLASGSTAKLQTIKVWNGSGVSISFYEVGEIIQRVWLDDPSQILIDTDGCLSGIDANCQNPGAGLIHLRRIRKVNVPGLPQTATTLLTIITQATDGTRKAYHFRVAPSNSRPEYSEISIVNDSPPESIATRPKLSPLVVSINSTRQIRAGMSIAIRNGWLKQSDELYHRLEQFLTYLQSGSELGTAANQANVSLKLVNKLRELGESSSRFSEVNQQ